MLLTCQFASNLDANSPSHPDLSPNPTTRPFVPVASSWHYVTTGVLPRRALDYTRAHTHTPPTGPPQTATCAETDDASRPNGVAARGLGAGVCSWTRALKPEQTLSLQGSRYVDPSVCPEVFRRSVWGRNRAVGVRSILTPPT